MKMRNPNGYGSVIKLGGKRRKPFAVRVTTGWDNNGKQIYKYLGTFATKKEAEHHLVHYNENPYNIEIQSITFLEVYEKWKNEKFETVGHSAQLGYIAAFKKSEPLHSIKFVDLKASHLQEIVLNPDVKYGTKRKIKVLFNQLYLFENFKQCLNYHKNCRYHFFVYYMYIVIFYKKTYKCYNTSKSF